jgi:predicted dehydrogenase
VNQVRLGIVGCGSISEWRHLPAIVCEVPEIKVVALCNRSGARLRLLADRYRIPSADCYEDFRPMLRRDDIDALLIAASPNANSEIVPEAALAGKHCFVEKPMAGSAAEARSMGEAVERAGVLLQVGFNKRFYYAYREAQRLIAEGRLGSPTGVSARFWFSPTQRRPLTPVQQVLHQNGIHFLDLVQFFMGTAIEVCARAREVQGRLTVAATLTFESSATGSLLLSSCGSWNYPNERVDIVGSNGCCLTAENGRRLTLFEETGLAHVFEQSLSAHWLTGNAEAGFSLQLRAFAESILQGNPAKVGPQDGLRSLLLAEAAELSLKTARPVSVASVEEGLVKGVSP